jgi:hypothetical protein
MLRVAQWHGIVGSAGLIAGAQCSTKLEMFKSTTLEPEHEKGKLSISMHCASDITRREARIFDYKSCVQILGEYNSPPCLRRNLHSSLYTPPTLLAAYHVLPALVVHIHLVSLPEFYLEVFFATAYHGSVAENT